MNFDAEHKHSVHNILYTFSPRLQMLIFYYIFFSFFLQCFLKHLRISCRPNTPLSLSAQCVFPKSKGILFQYHSTMNKIRKLSLIRYYYVIYRPCTQFTNCPSNVLYNKRKSWLRRCIQLSCLFSLIYLEQFCSVSLQVLWNYENILLFLKLSSTNFSTHW